MWEVGRLVQFFMFFSNVQMSRCGFEYCHDEPGHEPDEGIVGDLEFTWLGALQYININKGIPEYFRVPRVVLVSTQYALCTAADAALVPDGYALGNVIFDQYERDEIECELTKHKIESGAECVSAILYAPIADVFLHPEYNQFGHIESLALLQLLKPVKTRYLLPICLPFRNNMLTKHGKPRKKILHIDYLSVTPRNMMVEDREISKISVLPKHECGLRDNNTNPDENPVICSTGCEFHSGAPSMVHEPTGHWTLASLALGGCPCPDPLRPEKASPPARHILVYPYIDWITKIITGIVQAPFAKDDPFGFAIPQASEIESKNKFREYKQFGQGWVGHVWRAGVDCYHRGESVDSVYKFYSEKFQIPPDGKTRLNYHLEIQAPPNSVIKCVKVGLPYQVISPKVWDLGTTMVKLQVPVLNINRVYKFQVDAWVGNDTVTKEETSVEQEDEEIKEEI